MSLEGWKAVLPAVTPPRDDTASLRLAGDLVIWAISPVLALLLRFDGGPLEQTPAVLALTVLLFVAFKLALAFTLRLHRSSWRRTALPDIAKLGRFLALAAVGPTVILLVTGPGLEVPRSIPLLDALLSFLLMGSARAGVRTWYEEAFSRPVVGSSARRRALIVGAGEAGTLVARDMRRHPEKGLKPVGFLDDDPKKLGQRIAGIPVLGPTGKLVQIARNHDVDEVLIAIPSAANKVVGHLKAALAEAPEIKYRVMPGVYELLDGKVKLERLRDVEVGDLLRRPPVELDTPSILAQLGGKTVLVTGAGGSIGSELVRQICAYRPGQLILLGHGENSLYKLERELDAGFPDIPYRSVVGAVQNGLRLAYLFRQYRPDAVFHAAAHKHVPLMELNPEEAVFNNILGSRNLVKLAREYGVRHFVNISTDKAVNPSSIMGASKRMVECIVQREAARAQPDQVFVSVRFGNVLGSRGSVIPLFERQIRAGGPVTVTHPDMVRYFMTIPEAVQLVLQAGAHGRNGEIYILDMGEPVKIVDLACDMIRLAGFEPGIDIDIRFTGMRPGEKLVEELMSDGERHSTTTSDGIFVAKALEFDPDQLDVCLERLTAAALDSDSATVRSVLSEFLPGCSLQASPDRALIHGPLAAVTAKAV